MSQSTATGLLRDEHRLILEVTRVLSEIMQSETPGGWDLDTVEDCVTFFRLFADACHHGKEEDLLFPELEEHGMPSDSGPVAVMLYEHTLGREHVRRMAAALEGARSGDEVAATELGSAARDYIELIRAHIGKEDDVLFVMADQMVVGSACDRLCADYAAVCARRFEGRTLEELERLAGTLRQRYP